MPTARVKQIYIYCLICAADQVKCCALRGGRYCCECPTAGFILRPPIPRAVLGIPSSHIPNLIHAPGTSMCQQGHLCAKPLALGHPIWHGLGCRHVLVVGSLMGQEGGCCLCAADTQPPLSSFSPDLERGTWKWVFPAYGSAGCCSSQR